LALRPEFLGEFGERSSEPDQDGVEAGVDHAEGRRIVQAFTVPAEERKCCTSQR
jgi:hypothetical protein